MKYSLATAAFAVSVFALPGLGAIDLDFPVDFPNFTGLDATIEINGQPCEIRVRIGLDDRGKYGCIPGGCTVNGAPVEAKGSLKKKKSADGGALYFYSASLKSPRDASEKVSIKVTGELTTGVATFSYKGPKGKLTLTDHPVNLLADLGLKIGSVSLDPELVKFGKFGGTGSMTLGFGNDPADPGPLKIAIKLTSLKISLKVGKWKFALKATLDGDEWVGTLTVSAKPVKLKQPYSIPAVDELAPPPPPPGRCNESKDAAQQGEPILHISMVNDPQTFAGSVSVHRTPAGNIYVNASYSDSFDSHYFGDENCMQFDVYQTASGQWFCIDVERYDFNTNRLTAAGVLCFEIEHATPLRGGRWSIRNRSGTVATGTWSADRPICGNQVLDGPSISAELRDRKGAPIGSLEAAPTERGSTSVRLDLFVGEARFLATEPCLDNVPVEGPAPGPWFCTPLYLPGDGGLNGDLAGRACFTVTETSPYLGGEWSAVDLQEVEIAGGTWKGTVPVCGGIEADAELYATFRGDGDAFLGNFSLWPTTGGKHHLELDVIVGKRSLNGTNPCVDVDIGISTPGSWFTADLIYWDGFEESPAGTIEISIAVTAAPRSGTFVVRDLEGAELGSGDWNEDEF